MVPRRSHPENEAERRRVHSLMLEAVELLLSF
jgi:hypothetical protein